MSYTDYYGCVDCGEPLISLQDDIAMNPDDLRCPSCLQIYVKKTILAVKTPEKTPQPTIEEIKNCPFCGRLSAYLCTRDGGDMFVFVRCHNCGATTKGLIRKDDDKAITLWNTRPIEDGLRAEIERLKTELSELRKFVGLLGW